MILYTTTYMITWKCLALHDNLVSLLARMVEAPQQQVYIRRQRPHDRHFTLKSSHNRRHEFRSGFIDINKRGKQLVVVWNKVSGHAFGRPCPEIVIDVLSGIPGLEAQ